MDLDDPKVFALFLEIYGTLPRAGPGSREDTLRALAMVPGDSPATVLDLGCGPGAQTLVLAEALPSASIIAMDLTPQMVAEAGRRCAEAGLGERVQVRRGDMLGPVAPPASQDLVWCEGAIYFAGIENALRTWKPLLTPGGTVAFTEPIWLQPSPPEDLLKWWRDEYSAMTDEDGVRAVIRSAGFDTIGFFALPAVSWWTEYYGPMEDRVQQFLKAHPDDPIAANIADEATREIETFRSHSDFYSYGFFVVRPAP